MCMRPFVLLAATLASAQTAPQLTFEVASIKPHPEPITLSADPSIRGRRVTGTASTLVDLVTVAYNVKYDQIAGAPKWASSDHYDLEAKAPDGEGALTKEQFRQMMQA